MIADDLQRIRRDFKDRATALRNREQYDRAIDTLEKALHELRSLTPEGVAEERALRAEMADTYGIKGGVYRRAGDNAHALEQYRFGAKHEDEDRVSTYNIANVITLEITSERRSPAHPDVQAKLARVIEQLEADTRGARQDEWWAWFDLGQAYLLSGRLPEAQRCYERGVSTGARGSDVERHVQILEELRDATAETSPTTSRDIEAAIAVLRTHID
jgi:tetratricopeptide (TPR) repeat protein